MAVAEAGNFAGLDLGLEADPELEPGPEQREQFVGL